MTRVKVPSAIAALALGLLLWGAQAPAEPSPGPEAAQPAAPAADSAAAESAAETTTELATPESAGETGDEAGKGPAVPDSVEEILQTPADEEAYGDSPQCLSINRIRDSEVLDGQHVVFRVGRDTYYLVQFKRRCPLLDRNDTIMYTVRTSRLCVLDSIRSVEGAAYGSPPGPPCPIPSFRQISEEQLDALRDALQQPRKGDLIDEQESPAAEGTDSAEPATGSDVDTPG
jgi:hypothetical protein